MIHKRRNKIDYQKQKIYFQELILKYFKNLEV